MPKKVILGFPKLDARHRKMAADLKRMPDSAIDYSEIPEQNERGWKRSAEVFPEIEAALAVQNPQPTLELDEDVTEWLQSLGKRASRVANSALRAAMKAGQ